MHIKITKIEPYDKKIKIEGILQFDDGDFRYFDNLIHNIHSSNFSNRLSLGSFD